jgi:hypothetical protein
VRDQVDLPAAAARRRAPSVWGWTY